MKITEEKVFNEAVKFEMSMSKLYTLFKNVFIEDADFWEELASQERTHAKALVDFMNSFDLKKELSSSFTSTDLSKVKANNTQIKKIITEFSPNSKRKEAFRTAIKLENSSTEEQFRSMIKTETNPKIIKIFKVIVEQDKSHYQRLVDYITENNIKI